MVNARTECVLAACVHARIAALLRETRSIRAAVIVDDALGIRTNGHTAVRHATHAVGSTR